MVVPIFAFMAAVIRRRGIMVRVIMVFMVATSSRQKDMGKQDPPRSSNLK
jgi:hypothetical protein